MAKPYNEQQNKKQQIEEMFDTIAPRYDLLNKMLSIRIDRIWRKKLVKMAMKSSPSDILDVACGTGDLTIALHKRIPNAKFTGLDLSQQMIEIAKKKTEHINCEFLHSEVEKIPISDNQFDLVTCAFGVRNFGNLELGLTEMARILRPNGKMMILEFSKAKNPLFKFYFKHILPTIGGWISGDKKAYQYLPTSVSEFPEKEKFVSLLKSIGMQSVNSKSLTGSIVTIYTCTKHNETN